jgi:hypothetical protein
MQFKKCTRLICGGSNNSSLGAVALAIALSGSYGIKFRKPGGNPSGFFVVKLFLLKINNLENY